MRHAAPGGLALALGLGLAACGSPVGGPPPASSFGPNPQLPEPRKRFLMPTVRIAPAVGWPEGRAPRPAAGFAVSSFAAGLDHPRWLYVLPNGDVLVAETNAPPKPEQKGGLRTWIMRLVMKKAGAGVTSPNRITLL